MHYYISVLKKYAVFSGRARRSEFWYFALFNFLVLIVISIISSLVGLPDRILQAGYNVAVFVPSIAVTVRRLHDTGRSGWWIFIALIPLIGWIWLTVYMLIKGDAGTNKYGSSPKGHQAGEGGMGGDTQRGNESSSRSTI